MDRSQRDQLRRRKKRRHGKGKRRRVKEVFTGENKFYKYHGKFYKKCEIGNIESKNEEKELENVRFFYGVMYSLYNGLADKEFLSFYKKACYKDTYPPSKKPKK